MGAKEGPDVDGTIEGSASVTTEGPEDGMCVSPILLGLRDGTLVGLAVLGLSLTGFWVGSPVGSGMPSPT